MRIRVISAIVFVLAFTVVASAQDAPSAPPASQPPAQGVGAGGWQNREFRAGSGGRWAGTGMGGRGVTGIVSVVAVDHYTVKTDAGETYTVHFSANTRIMKQGTGMRQRGGRGPGGEGTTGTGDGAPPQTLKSTDIKIGDSIAALGEVDPAAKSVGAVVVLQIDPERARQMHEIQANYGKTWLQGKVTAIDGVKVTLMGAMDDTAHVVVADENTTFRKRREPITLADIQVGDTVRVEGAVKDGNFLATTISAMGAQGAPPTVPRDSPPPAQPAEPK